MRVYCITNNWRKASGFAIDFAMPKYGDTCEVVGETDDGVAYVLAEYPHPGQPVNGWHKRGFIPLSSISETEMVREYNKQLV
jgi:hypothetical protein